MEDHLPDEDALTIPAAWRRTLHARRGGAPGPRITVDAKAPETVRALIEETGGAVASLLEGRFGDQELTAAARRYLDGEADPAGAGAVAAVTVMGLGGPNRRDEVHRAFIDAWVTGHGVAFAACALVELSRTEAKRQGGGSWIGTSVGTFHRADGKLEYIAQETARRVRGLLAVAGESDYDDAVGRLARHRATTGTKWLVSYLVPTRGDWVDECCTTPYHGGPWNGLRWMSLSALGKASQLRVTRGLHWGDATRAQLATLVDGIGPDALTFLVGHADQGNLDSDERKRIFETVAVIPTDEAFQALVDRLDRKHVRPALGEAARRFPVRALRLLARAGATELLREHVQVHPELVAAVLPGLPDDVRAVAGPLAASSARVPAASAEEVPRVLADPVWERPRRPAVPGLAPPEPRLAWRDGERQAWLDADPDIREPDSADWETLVQGYKTGDHKTGSVQLLVPDALGTKAKQCRQAETALRYLADAHGPAAVADAARAGHGGDAAKAVEELLSARPVETGLDRPAKIGDWVDPAVLPQVLLRGRDRALPPDAARRLIELLALPSPYGMDELAEACEPESVAAFGWALFQKWLDAGNPAKDAWAMAQLGRTGDDETVRLLTPVIRTLPGTGGHKIAVDGLGVLAEIGTDVALMHLHGIAQKVKFKGLQAEAQRRIREVAERLALSPEQLADRLVPAFGLDAEGGMTLDYGPRRFVVGFDEQLMPFVADEDGKRRKALPKPAAKDDPELAPAAHKTFAALKKDVRTVASGQLFRLEQAMVTQRRWTPAEFRDFIVHHPLVWHIARRLVWVAHGGATTAAFRIAEDRTFADAGDDAFTLPASAEASIAHPLQLGDTVAAWSEVLADYEITQPFPQLSRPVHTLAEDEKDGGRLTRFEGVTVPFGDVLALVRRGWRRGEPQDAGGERWISRRVADDRYVVIDLDPGISVGAVDATGDHQTLDYVWFATEPCDYWPKRGTPLRFGDLDPVMASEVLTDLTALAEADVR